MARNFTISLSATAFTPARGAIAGATITTQAVTNSHRVAWACDDTTVEGAASVPFVCPDEYTGSGTLKARVFFASGTQNSGTAAFNISFEAITPGDTLNVTTADSFDTGSVGSTNLSGSTAGDLLAQTITIANKDNVAAGDQVRLAFTRNTGTDSVSDDLYVYLVELYEET
jgi:uncharacterized membrane protein